MSTGEGREDTSDGWEAWERQLRATVVEHDQRLAAEAELLVTQVALAEARARIAELEAALAWRGAA